jgi:hypothetical protein
MRLTIQQVAEYVPAYNVLCDGADIGTITSFPGEGPMGTIRYNGSKHTVAGETVAAVLMLLEDQVALEDYYASEEEIYDEDGSIAYAQMLERQSEIWSAQDECPY